jgi:hypothetical protein
LLINTLVLPYLVDKTISLSTNSPSSYHCTVVEGRKKEEGEEL